MSNIIPSDRTRVDDGSMRILTDQEIEFVAGAGGFPGNPYIRHQKPMTPAERKELGKDVVLGGIGFAAGAFTGGLGSAAVWGLAGFFGGVVSSV